jgi:hypothetical protein
MLKWKAESDLFYADTEISLRSGLPESFRKVFKFFLISIRAERRPALWAEE